MDENTASALGAFAVIFLYLVIFLSPIVVLVVGGLIGAWQERNHFDDLARREAEFLSMLVTDLKTPPPGMSVGHAALVDGSVVIASDHFKTFCAKFRKFFGGEFAGLRRMQERARREALLRMMESARQIGATAVCNVRIETSTISGNRPDKIGGCEVIAFGTALIPGASKSPPPLPVPGRRQQIIG